MTLTNCFVTDPLPERAMNALPYVDAPNPRRASDVGLIPMLGIFVLVGTACGQDDIVEPPVVTATVYGTATIAGQGVAGRPVVADGFALQCQQHLAVVGSALTDANGAYRITLGGSASTGPICVRVGFPSATGSDTVFAIDTVDIRTAAPYDSVLINLNRATP